MFHTILPVHGVGGGRGAADGGGTSPQDRPEDRELFVEYVRGDAMAQTQLRAPPYEDKVVEFLFDRPH